MYITKELPYSAVPGLPLFVLVQLVRSVIVSSVPFGQLKGSACGATYGRAC